MKWHAAIAAGGIIATALGIVALEPGASPREVAAPAEVHAPAAVQEPGYPFAPYDGRFTFVRVRFDPANSRSMRFGGGGGRNPPWFHDYPISDKALSAIVAELTNLRTSTQVTNIIGLDDPIIYKFPILYLSEPGYWNPTDKEVESLRAYLSKGGFMIFDDFADQDWPNFALQMQRVMPELRPIILDGSEPIFHTFFEIDERGLHMENYRGTAQFYGFFEQNDKTKRQIAMVNFRNDIGEIMEYSATGFYPVDLSNEAFKIGVNLIIYALTH